MQKNLHEDVTHVKCMGISFGSQAWWCPLLGVLGLSSFGEEFSWPISKVSSRSQIPSRLSGLLNEIDWCQTSLTMEGTQAQKFLWSDIICRHGSLSIATNNGNSFENSTINNFLEEKWFFLRFSSVAHPQTNRQAKVANKRIMTILKAQLSTVKGKWADQLPTILWVYRTTPSTTSVKLSFALAFKIPQKEELGKQMEENDESYKVNLDLLEGRRDLSLIKQNEHRARTERYYNHKFRVQTFKKGDLVFKNVKAVAHLQGRNKLSPKWEGQFIIKEITRKNAYRLQDNDENEAPHSWNGDHLKRFFPWLFVVNNVYKTKILDLLDQTCNMDVK